MLIGFSSSLLNSPLCPRNKHAYFIFILKDAYLINCSVGSRFTVVPSSWCTFAFCADRCGEISEKTRERGRRKEIDPRWNVVHAREQKGARVSRIWCTKLSTGIIEKNRSIPAFARPGQARHDLRIKRGRVPLLPLSCLRK